MTKRSEDKMQKEIDELKKHILELESKLVGRAHDVAKLCHSIAVQNGLPSNLITKEEIKERVLSEINYPIEISQDIKFQIIDQFRIKLPIHTIDGTCYIRCIDVLGDSYI